MSCSETSEYVEHALDWPYPNAAAETIYAKSEGNPLFMIKMVRDLLTDGPDATVSRVAAGIRDFVGRRFSSSLLAR